MYMDAYVHVFYKKNGILIFFYFSFYFSTVLNTECMGKKRMKMRDFLSAIQPKSS